MTELMRRRRALMAAKEELPSVLLSSLQAGAKLLISENGTQKPYIYLGPDGSGNLQVMRACGRAVKRINASVMKVINYAGTEMDTFLTGSFLNVFTDKLKSFLRNTNVPYYKFDSNSSAQTVETMSRKCYLPSYYQLGYGGSEGGTSFISALRAYNNATSDNNARKCNNDSGSKCSFWMCSAYNSGQNRFRCTDATTGSASYAQATTAGPYYRPVLSFADTTTVVETADGYVLG